MASTFVNHECECLLKPQEGKGPSKKEELIKCIQNLNDE